MKQNGIKNILGLFVKFLEFGLFTFGGGWSIVAQMQRTYVEDKKILSQEELMDITTVGRSMPGTMIGNVAFMFGYHVQGIPGGIACVIGMIIPPTAVISVITFFYTKFQTNLFVAAAMRGVRAAVVPILISAIIGMVKSAYKFPPCFAVTIITIGLLLFTKINFVIIILFGLVSGLLISELYARREKNADLSGGNKKPGEDK